MSPHLRKFLLRLGLLFLGASVAVVAAEWSLRARERRAGAFYVWWPNLDRTQRIAKGVMPGVEGESRFRANSMGLRGRELERGDVYRVLCIGGSTTECLVLDQEDTWPAVLERRLNALEGPRTWVGNAGKSGLNTRDHVVQLRYLLPQLPRMDVALILEGVNDLALRLSRDEDYDPRYLEREDAETRLMGRAFQLMPLEFDRRLTPYKRTALWRFASRLKNRWFPDRRVQEDAGGAIRIWRKHRRTASELRDELPDLTSALAEYRNNLETLVAQCRRHGLRVVLLTQPSIWRNDLPPEVERYLWCGGVGDFMNEPGHPYYSVAALARGMAAYNEVLLETANALGVESVDLASALPRDLSVFYDDVHFNREGARRVALVLADYLGARPPFGMEAVSPRPQR